MGYGRDPYETHQKKRKQNTIKRGETKKDAKCKMTKNDVRCHAVRREIGCNSACEKINGTRGEGRFDAEIRYSKERQT